MNRILTRRGWTVLLVTCLAFGGGAIFGARSFDAVVIPSVLALGVAVAFVRWTGDPVVDWTPPEDGFPGEECSITLTLDGHRHGRYDVAVSFPEGVTVESHSGEATVGEGSVTYDVRFDRRGAYDLGPVTVTMTDALGLARRTVTCRPATEEFLVYPPLTDPPSRITTPLESTLDLEAGTGRDEFDRLREYDRSDSIRDVHWKSSAKRPDDDLVVKEFVETSHRDGVSIAVGASGHRGTVDAAARAGASVATYLLDQDVDVGVTTPAETVAPASGDEHRRAVLGALARLSSNPRPDVEHAQVAVDAIDGEAVVVVEDRSLSFETGAERPAPSGVVP